MSTTCRDCGNVLLSGVRGCPRCALNVEAEDMIRRVFWRLVLPAALLLVVLLVIAVMYRTR